mmetsp:Transcript_17627/g.30485  ORF Transcript_17627/g.30485 Transcript_17627/m.30485 type:complete len:323 (+) Transcript_17627:388-1356(+)
MASSPSPIGLGCQPRAHPRPHHHQRLEGVENPTHSPEGPRWKHPPQGPLRARQRGERPRGARRKLAEELPVGGHHRHVERGGTSHGVPELHVGRPPGGVADPCEPRLGGSHQRDSQLELRGERLRNSRGVVRRLQRRCHPQALRLVPRGRGALRVARLSCIDAVIVRGHRGVLLLRKRFWFRILYLLLHHPIGRRRVVRWHGHTHTTSDICRQRVRSVDYCRGDGEVGGTAGSTRGFEEARLRDLPCGVREACQHGLPAGPLPASACDHPRNGRNDQGVPDVAHGVRCGRLPRYVPPSGLDGQVPVVPDVLGNRGPSLALPP